MKYYLVTVQNDSTQSIFAYSNVDDALVAFHTELAYHAEDRNRTLCIIFDSSGECIRKEEWVRI